MSVLDLAGNNKVITTANGVSQTEEENIEFGNGAGQYDRLDIGANFMAAYILNSGLMLKVNYSLGFLNLSNDTDFKYKNQYFGVSLGLFFHAGREINHTLFTYKKRPCGAFFYFNLC